MSRNWLCAWSLSLFMLFSFGCQKQLKTDVTPAWQPPTAETLASQYLAAVKDAADPAQPDDIYRELWVIDTANEKLRWKTIAGEVHVLVATWTSWDGYDDKVEQQMDISRKIWITLVPQMQDFCTTYKGPLDLDLRLKQLLGMPQTTDKTKVIEMWVRPEDLFRPCADPGIADYECQGMFPSSAYITLAQEYIDWFNNQVSISYADTDPYPWTRLGYTYDWNADTPKFGLSEYIVREKSIVWIETVAATADYCVAND